MGELMEKITFAQTPKVPLNQTIKDEEGNATGASASTLETKLENPGDADEKLLMRPCYADISQDIVMLSESKRNSLNVD